MICMQGQGYSVASYVCLFFGDFAQHSSETFGNKDNQSVCLMTMLYTVGLLTNFAVNSGILRKISCQKE